MSQTATTEAPAWQQQAADQLAEIGITDTTTHVVVNLTDAGDGVVLALADSEEAGIESADEQSTKVTGEVTIVPIDILRPLIGDLEQPLETETTTELGLAATGLDEDAPAIAGAPDPDKGTLFDVPRVAIDESDPSQIKITISGEIVLDRSQKNDVDFYNGLRAGKTVELNVEAHVGSTKTTHRRDKEGDVDAIIQGKALIIHSIDTSDETT